MQVISTSGDTHLGGEDFDHRVMDYFIKLIKKKYKTDISKDSRALQKLRREAERAKRALSSQHQVGALAPVALSCVGCDRCVVLWPPPQALAQASFSLSVASCKPQE